MVKGVIREKTVIMANMDQLVNVEIKEKVDLLDIRDKMRYKDWGTEDCMEIKV